MTKSIGLLLSLLLSGCVLDPPERTPLEKAGMYIKRQNELEPTPYIQRNAFEPSGPVTITPADETATTTP